MTSSSDEYKGVVFEFAKVIEEFEVFKKLASNFIDSKTIWALDTAKRALETIKSNAPSNQLTPWKINEGQALWTRSCKGGHMPDEKGRFQLSAGMSFMWEIQPIEVKKRGPRTHFCLDGLASILIRVHAHDGMEGTAPVEVAAWRVEVGAKDSPGYHFHIQMKEYEHEAPFPKGLDIPRLPSAMMTPLLAFESVIAEIFQDEWRRLVIQGGPNVERWRSIHQQRLERFFEWQKQVLANKKEIGTPWLLLKRARPQNPRFLVE